MLKEDMRVPPIIYVANKAENDLMDKDEFEEKFAEFQAGEEEFQVEPLYISAEHGDGMTDLYQQIQEFLPEDYKENQESKKERRLEKFQEYKQILLEEIVKDREKELKRRES